MSEAVKTMVRQVLFRLQEVDCGPHRAGEHLIESAPLALGNLRDAARRPPPPYPLQFPPTKDGPNIGVTWLAAVIMRLAL
ncbi:MAG: hypothetical protein IH975_09320 [Nitrospinae bacterium]|nr:hypothetical protein [Nitrospinota bacterium]